MATFFRCDRCKKETTNRSDLREIMLPVMNKYRTEFSNEDAMIMRKELCALCTRILYEALDPKPDPVNTDVMNRL